MVAVMPPQPYPPNLASCHAHLHIHSSDHSFQAHHLLTSQIADSTCSSTHKTYECIDHSLVTPSTTCKGSQILLAHMQAEPLHCDGHTFVALLMDCTKSKDLERGTGLHSEIAKTNLLEKDPFVGNTLVDMYAKCGSITKAQEVFEDLVLQDVVSWNALIGGYANLERGEEALTCFERMQLEGMFPNAFTYVCSLKACGSLKSITKGKEIHAKLLIKGLLKKNIFAGNALVDMYAKHGLLIEAQRVFDELPIRDVVSWNVLIAGYVQHEAGDKALSCFEKMQCEGILPTAVTFVCAFKACAAIGAAKKVWQTHAQIVQEWLLENKNNYGLGITLIDMYVKCGLLTNAKDVFSKLPARDVVAYATLIAGYVEHEDVEQIFECAEQMRVEGIFGNPVTFSYRLKACGIIGATKKGAYVHIEISETRWLENNDAVVGNALVAMYAKCGLLSVAQSVLRNLSVRDVVSWTALIAGYVKYDCSEEALNCFEQMQRDGVSPNEVSFVCSLKACGFIGATEKGSQLHAEIARKGLLNGSLVVGNALVDMYTKFGFLVKAREVFDLLSVHDVVSWTAMIAGYTSHDCGEQALNCFEQMKLEGILPNSVTIVCSLQACGTIGATNKGRDIHAEFTGKGFLEGDLVVGNALISMYAKLGLFLKAREVIDNLLARNVVSWTALIAGYVHRERGEEALTCFEHMQLEGISPNAVTFICSLKACGSIKALDKGIEIHAEILKLGIMGQHYAVGNALVDMYASCGFVEKAQEVFDQLLIRDLVSWNALMSGYAKNNHAMEALKCFEHMQFSGFSPDPTSFVCCLKACGSIGAIHKGCEVHAEIARRGLFETNPVVGNALVDMYAKCGLPAKVQEVFDKLLVRDTVSWTALITAYAQLGRNQSVFSVFDDMKREGRDPDSITFTSVLKTCNQACLVDKGQMFFEAISKEFGIIPTVEHHTCMVDLLGQAGHLDKAVTLIENMPVDLDIGVWHTLLDVCQRWGIVDLGQKAFKNAMQLDDKNSAGYVRMSNIYVDASMHDNSNKAEVKNHAWCMPRHCERNVGEHCVSGLDSGPVSILDYSLSGRELTQNSERNNFTCKNGENSKILSISNQQIVTSDRSSIHTYARVIKSLDGKSGCTLK